jgi:hypothetical protein
MERSAMKRTEDVKSIEKVSNRYINVIGKPVRKRHLQEPRLR